MNKLLLCLALVCGGCRGTPAGLTVIGSAYVETDRPEGKAVAKVEVQYNPTLTARPERKANAIPEGEFVPIRKDDGKNKVSGY